MADIKGLDSFLNYMQRVEGSINNIIEQSLDWTTKSKSKFNKLRQEANLEKINFNIS